MASGMTKYTLNVDELRSVEVFARLDDSAFTEVQRRCHGLAYLKGHEIVTHGDTSRDVHFIVHGQVRVNVYALSGRHVTFELLDAGQMFGELAAIDGLPRSAGVVAESDVVTACMTEPNFRDLIRRSPDAAQSVLERMAVSVRWLSAKVYEHSAMNSSGRLYTELLRLAARSDVSALPILISAAPTDRDLGSRIGVARELVSRTMSRLRKLGVIERRGRDLLIFDCAALRELLEDEGAG